MKVLFLAKHKPFAEDAAEMLRNHFEKAEIVFGKMTDPFPQHILNMGYDYVISYISPWIVPAQVLMNAGIAAVNFHPGPPEYPGIGCTNFALYNGAKDFGITVHHMNEKVDSGRIIAVERFPVFEKDSVYSLSQRCYAYIYKAFVELFLFMAAGEYLPESKEVWQRKPYTRKQLNDLCRITTDMTEDEIKNRVRATAFPDMPRAYIELAGNRFEYNAQE
jgi:methionyl-tRNA formyltransferase